MPAGYTDIVFSIKDEHLTRFVEGIAAHFGYRETDENGDPNSETKAQYSKRKLRQQMVLWVKKEERRTAINAIAIEDIDAQ